MNNTNKKKRKIRRRRWATQTLLLIKYLHIISCNMPFIYTDFAEQRGWIEAKTSLSPQERMFAIFGRFFALVSPVNEFESRLARNVDEEGEQQKKNHNSRRRPNSLNFNQHAYLKLCDGVFQYHKNS